MFNYLPPSRPVWKGNDRFINTAFLVLSPFQIKLHETLKLLFTEVGEKLSQSVRIISQLETHIARTRNGQIFGFLCTIEPEIYWYFSQFLHGKKQQQIQPVSLYKAEELVKQNNRLQDYFQCETTANECCLVLFSQYPGILLQHIISGNLLH